ncbi:MAG: carboxypeptidase-like regulatory domain-containing protein, partial [Vicinamibacterales bacterium]
MKRLALGIRVLAVTAVVGVTGGAGASSALAQSVQYQSVHAVRGSITGVVSDDHGGPISGAMVSALGTVMVAKAITDASGYFSIDALPAGDYTLQAHRTG